MARFVFPYQTLLRHRERVEDERQRELAEQMRLRLILTNHLQQMQQTVRDSRHDLGQSLVGRVDMSQVGQFAAYSARVTNAGHAMVRRLAEVEKNLVTARQRLLEATSQRKALELLRDRQQAAWQQDQNRREAATLDDLALQTHQRNLLEEAWSSPVSEGSTP